VALLRGINVGGKNLLPMQDLVALFDGAGCTNAKSYIQSGNIVFRAPPAVAARIPAVIAKAVTERFGFEAPVLVRSDQDLARVAKENPFLGAGADEALLHVAFLAESPGAAQVAALDAGRSPPDEFTVRGREIYLRCPNGMARTRLTNQYFDAKLSTTSTMRNWRTVLKLLDMTRS
jgi:uncharacterized protein (DUF1697 family)